MIADRLIKWHGRIVEKFRRPLQFRPVDKRPSFS